MDYSCHRALRCPRRPQWTIVLRSAQTRPCFIAMTPRCCGIVSTTHVHGISTARLPEQTDGRMGRFQAWKVWGTWRVDPTTLWDERPSIGSDGDYAMRCTTEG